MQPFNIDMPQAAYLDVLQRGQDQLIEYMQVVLAGGRAQLGHVFEPEALGEVSNRGCLTFAFTLASRIATSLHLLTELVVFRFGLGQWPRFRVTNRVVAFAATAVPVAIGVGACACRSDDEFKPAHTTAAMWA